MGQGRHCARHFQACQAQIRSLASRLETDLRSAGLGYAFPVLFGEDTAKVWNLRNAGLGLLSNMPGDAKPVPVIEDTAVRVADLPEYIAECDRILKERFELECVHYAHAGAGEIHLRPLINLKTAEGNRLFREVASAIADLVKRYRGSLSGEHGDGRLRGEFIERMVGSGNYAHIRSVKRAWDPRGVFNPGKIVDTPPMNASLRYAPGQKTEDPDTLFDWSSTKGMLRAAEMCNGSGDCRKTHLAGGTMCPSYMATRDEKDTTRGRANMLRHALTQGAADAQHSVFDNPDVKDALDLCLSRFIPQLTAQELRPKLWDMELGLRGKTAFVTGASSGIGAEAARLLAEEGADVFVGYHRNLQGAEKTVRNVQAAGAAGWAIQLDVGDVGSVAAAVTRIKGRKSQLDALVLNSSMLEIAAFDALEPEQWERVIRANLSGPFFVIRAIAPLLSEGAGIVTVSSVSAHTGAPHHADYAAAKAGLINLTKSAARALAPGARVNCIAPGMTLTPMGIENLKSLPPDYAEKKLLAKRFARPEEIARFIVFMASPAASFMYGATIDVNGGRDLR